MIPVIEIFPTGESERETPFPGKRGWQDRETRPMWFREPTAASMASVQALGCAVDISESCLVRFPAWRGFSKVPYKGCGKFCCISFEPTSGPRQSPVILSVPMQRRTRSSYFLFK